MRLQNPFAALDSAGLDSQVLTVLAGTEEYLTIQDIHRLLPESGSREGVRKSIARLVLQGTVLERVTGRSAAFALNRDHLLATPILMIANAKQEFVSRLASEISEWAIQPVTVTLFGSAARNEMRVDSDIDLLLVMPDEADHDEALALVYRLVSTASKWTGNDVQPIVYSSSEIKAATVFDEIVRDGIHVAGERSWLRKQIRSKSAAA